MSLLLSVFADSPSPVTYRTSAYVLSFRTLRNSIRWARVLAVKPGRGPGHRRDALGWTLTATTTRDLLIDSGLIAHEDELRMSDLLYVSGHR
jgi:hypothetical protein